MVMYANEYYLCGTNNFLKRKLKIFIIDVSFGKKKGCEQKRNDCSLNHAFFFRYFLPKQSLVSQFLVSERKKTLKAMEMMTSQTAISPLLILPH